MGNRTSRARYVWRQAQLATGSVTQPDPANIYAERMGGIEDGRRWVQNR